MAQPSHRDQLIRGAMKCLRTKGYARTTARDIAAASEANLASIGYHFGSKEALLNEAMIRIFKRRDWKVGETTNAPGDSTPLERLRALFVAASDVFDAPRPLFVSFVEAIGQAGYSEELRERLAEHYRNARKGAAGTALAILGPAADRLHSDPEVVASFVIALFDGLVLQWLLDPDQVPKGEELMTAIMEMTALVRDESGAPPKRRSRPRATKRPAARGSRRSAARA